MSAHNVRNELVSCCLCDGRNPVKESPLDPGTGNHQWLCSYHSKKLHHLLSNGAHKQARKLIMGER